MLTLEIEIFFCLLKRDWRKETWSVTLQLVTKISFQSSKWKIAWKIHFELTTRFFLLCRGSQDLIKAIKHHLGVYTLKITVYVNEWAMEILEDSQIIVQQKKNKISIHTTQLQNMSLTIFNFKINLATMFKICAGDKNFLKTSNNKNGAKNIKSKDI